MSRLLLLLSLVACATARGGPEPQAPRHQIELLLPPDGRPGPLQVACALTPSERDRMRVVYTVTASETVLVAGERLSYLSTVQPFGETELALYSGLPPDLERTDFYPHMGFFDFSYYTLVRAGETLQVDTWLVLDFRVSRPTWSMSGEPAEAARPLRCALTYWPVPDEAALTPGAIDWRARQYATSSAVVVRGVEAPRDP